MSIEKFHMVSYEKDTPVKGKPFWIDMDKIVLVQVSFNGTHSCLWIDKCDSWDVWEPVNEILEKWVMSKRQPLDVSVDVELINSVKKIANR